MQNESFDARFSRHGIAIGRYLETQRQLRDTDQARQTRRYQFGGLRLLIMFFLKVTHKIRHAIFVFLRQSGLAEPE